MHTNAPSKYSPQEYPVNKIFVEKSTLGYARAFERWGSFARNMASLLMAAWMMCGVATQARAETVPSIPALTSMPTTGGWHMGYPAFPGRSSGQAVCDLVGRVFNPDSINPEYTGICGTEYFLVAFYAQTCPAGYYFRYSTAYPIQETCYKNFAPNQCPSVAADETSFTLDPGGLTCSRPDKEKLTLTLSGDTTTEPWHKKRDKEHTSANLPYQAIVRDQNGQPKANVSVTISADVTSDSGGHIHINGRPKGKLVAATAGTVSTKDGTDTITGITDGSGVFAFTFGAEEASGSHTLMANCTGCKAPANSTINVAIQGLMLLDADPLSYELRGETDTHINNHYFSPAAMVKVINLAHGYREKFGTLLKINDSSLIKGGLFDITGNWAPSHKSHRRGIVLDINNYRVERNKGFERFALDNYGIIAEWEGSDVTPTPHYHLLLTGKDN